MSTTSKNMMKGIGAGIVMGAAAGMLLKTGKKKSGKRIMTDAVKAFGDVAETISDVMGW